MLLALVHDWLTGMRGGEKCLEVLCRRFPDARLHTLFRAAGSVSPAIARMTTVESPLARLPGITRYYRYLLPIMPWAVQRLKLPRDVELVLSLSHAVAKGIVPPPGVPHVCYCFTPMRYAWQMRGEYFGSETFRTPLTWARDRMLDRVREWDRISAQRVTHFVAISQTIRQRIRECYDRESSVIYPPVDTDFYAPREGSPPREDFFLIVSALVPYKRVELAMEACRILNRRLVIIGSGPERRKLESRASERISFLGWQTDEVIRDHLCRARALLFPGLEDFGIVPLEAQACGTPVIAFGRGGATETIVPPTAGTPGTGLFFSEPNAASLSSAIEAFERSPSSYCPAAARANALQFSRSRFEQELVALIENIHQPRRS